MAVLELNKINKIYPNGVQAVHDFNLKIEDREFVVLVGPSGCGKSTTLRMVAGLEEITSGDFYIDGVRVNDLQPKERDVAMVFQSYALYPHMTVYDNIGYGLKLRGMEPEEIDEKVREVADILELTPYLMRKPKSLSGGQRQRVALGRAIVREAKVFLLDEPLSNLDAKLRVQMRTELIKIHEKISEKFNTSTIYVTHDQIEAMTMGDRIVVMRDGYIQQVDSPKEIYNNPVNMFVAGFMGTPPMNFIKGVVKSDGYFHAGDFKLEVPQGKVDILRDRGYIDQPIVFGIRPEDIHDEEIVILTYPNSTIEVKVELVELLGAETNLYFSINEQAAVASVETKEIHAGTKLKLSFDMNKCHFFNPKTELAIK
ncbi:sn-glycerol-3-phosphate ABC transporter ATP-binding protein UgpC [Acholeplasma equirhinis]|uniref:ABC transporter ATP-binding protein n=1 Tax=Acholeplasma equirhinis TaxID=555393 RepID=UPI00197AA7F4|nr:sn-glycerol-3-phosphate ABC transporter ATP-binding protein UgpC [Acholeplasma equirhinis]MBN3490751.1 sn-glycerol-3-phosphate ABC transporter ATP-binding protein UgpC [Acholeplasma equirhinis]